MVGATVGAAVSVTVGTAVGAAVVGAAVGAAVGAVVGPSVGASVSTADSVSSDGAVVKSEVVAGGALTTQAPKLQDLAQFGSMNSGFIWHSP